MNIKVTLNRPVRDRMNASLIRLKIACMYEAGQIRLGDHLKISIPSNDYMVTWDTILVEKEVS